LDILKLWGEYLNII